MFLAAGLVLRQCSVICWSPWVILFIVAGANKRQTLSLVAMTRMISGGVAPTVITATVRIIREVSATAVKALPVQP